MQKAELANNDAFYVTVALCGISALLFFALLYRDAEYQPR